MKKSAVSIFLAVVLAASFVGVFFIMSIMDLVNKKDIHTITITEAYSLLSVENSINGLIPTGKDYYYLGFCDGMQKMYVIHGDKNWLTEHFDNNGLSLDSNGVSIKGLAKRAGNFDVERELENRIAQVENYDSALNFGNVLELHYIRDAILRMIAGVLLLIVVGVGLFFKKSQKEIPSAAKKVFLGCFMVTLFFALVTIL